LTQKLKYAEERQTDSMKENRRLQAEIEEKVQKMDATLEEARNQELKLKEAVQVAEGELASAQEEIKNLRDERENKELQTMSREKMQSLIGEAMTMASKETVKLQMETRVETTKHLLAVTAEETAMKVEEEYKARIMELEEHLETACEEIENLQASLALAVEQDGAREIEKTCNAAKKKPKR